jgi:adenosylhomocysteine nucleosidase
VIECFAGFLAKPRQLVALKCHVIFLSSCATNGRGFTYLFSNTMSNLEIKPCQFGVIFAMGIESGSFEDLLSGTIRIRGSGFFITEGGLKGQRVVSIRSGAGRENAARAAQVLIDGHRPKIVISAGFAGGIDPSLKRHDILLADSVIDPSGEQIILKQSLPSPDSTTSDDLSSEGRPLQWPLALYSIAPSESIWPGLRFGKLLTVDHVVRDPVEKHTLYQQHQALAVDMETFAVAEVCRNRSVPLCAVRIVHDAAGDALPPDIERLLRQKSEPARLGAALAAIWRRPGSIKDLWALKEKSLAASAELAKFIEGLIEIGIH